jgi:hypothetical protein
VHTGHSTETAKLALCFQEFKSAVKTMFAFEWLPLYGISDGDQAIISLFATFFDEPLLWINCYAHLVMNFITNFATESTHEGEADAMLEDVEAMHFANTWVQAELMRLLFKLKHGETKFGDAYLTDAKFKWVASVVMAGLAKTNNGIENFNRQIAKLLLGRQVLPLRTVFIDLHSWVASVSKSYSIMKFAVSALDVLSVDMRETNRSVHDKILSRVRDMWKEGQALLHDADFDRFWFKRGAIRYKLCQGTYQKLVLQRRDSDDVRQAYDQLMYGCVDEFIAVASAVSVGGIATAVSTAANIKLLALLTGQSARLSGHLFDIYVFIMSLFWVYSGKFSDCSCPRYKHYKACKHHICQEVIQGRLSIPEFYDFTKLAVILRGRRTRGNKRRRRVASDLRN